VPLPPPWSTLQGRMLDGLLSEPRRTFVQLLEFDGEDLRGSPLTARKEVLACCAAGLRVLPSMPITRPRARSSTLLARLRGIVSKRLGSPYRASRADCSLKVKIPAAPAVTREAKEEWN
jgi:hypothetical protein